MTEENKEAHAIARDTRDKSTDAITAQLLNMVDHLQRDVIARMKAEEINITDLKNDMKQLIAKMDEFLSAFPDRDVTQHRLRHEDMIETERESREFWSKIRFTFWALVLVSATGWLGVVVWKAFLLGPK